MILMKCGTCEPQAWANGEFANDYLGMPKKEVFARGSKYGTGVKPSLSGKNMARFPDSQGSLRCL